MIKILLIDDEPIVREVFARLLTSLGHTVLQAQSGEAAITLLEAGEPLELVLTDLKMPGLSGSDVVRIVRDRWPGLRVGVISGSIDAIEKCRDFVDLAITKPVAVDGLKALFDPLLKP